MTKLEELKDKREAAKGLLSAVSKMDEVDMLMMLILLTKKN